MAYSDIIYVLDHFSLDNTDQCTQPVQYILAKCEEGMSILNSVLNQLSETGIYYLTFSMSAEIYSNTATIHIAVGRSIL